MPAIDPTDLIQYTIIKKGQSESTSTTTEPPTNFQTPDPSDPTGGTLITQTIPGYSYDTTEVNEIDVPVTGYINRNFVLNFTPALINGTIPNPIRTDITMTDGSIVTVQASVSTVENDLTT